MISYPLYQSYDWNVDCNVRRERRSHMSTIKILKMIKCIMENSGLCGTFLKTGHRSWELNPGNTKKIVL